MFIPGWLKQLVIITFCLTVLFSDETCFALTIMSASDDAPLHHFPVIASGGHSHFCIFNDDLDQADDLEVNPSFDLVNFWIPTPYTPLTPAVGSLLYTPDSSFFLPLIFYSIPVPPA